MKLAITFQLKIMVKIAKAKAKRTSKNSWTAVEKKEENTSVVNILYVTELVVVLLLHY